jgi:hypothetical protein
MLDKTKERLIQLESDVVAMKNKEREHQRRILRILAL